MRLPRFFRVVAVAATAFGLASAPIAADATDDAWRFWGYYQWDAGTWAFADTGPARTVPAEGAVEGWRHAASGSEPRFPRADGDFDLICGSTDAGAREKRVAVVIDFGTAADDEDGAEPPAARGACAVVPDDATGADVLAEAAGEVRYDESGLVCGIAGYPATGCVEPVDGEVPTGSEDPVELELSSGESGLGGATIGLLVGIAALVLVGTAAVFVTRRSRSAS